MIKKLPVLFLVFSLFACSDTRDTDTKMASSVTGEKFSEGTHYTRIKTPIATGSDNIVVTEFFWYGCPHCEHFEPVLAAWSKNKPADVILRQSPAVWREQMKLHAKMYFLVQTLPNKDLVHSALFPEIIALREEQDMDVQSRKLEQFLAKFGVSKEDYYYQMHSSALDAQVESAVQLMQQAGINGTPAIMVNGKYLVNNEHVTSMEQILEIADFLVEKERQAK